MTKTQTQLSPLVIVVINGGNYQGNYVEEGVGRPEVIVIDWDNIRGGDKPNLTERELEVIAKTEPDVAEELRKAMKPCDPGCALNMGDALDECNCSRLGNDYKGV